MKAMLRMSFCVFVLGVYIFGVGSSLIAQVRFVPANFFGLTIGKATIVDLTKRFGAPVSIHRDNSGTTWLYYRNIGPVPGKVEIEADSKRKVIKVISIYPERLSLENAKKIFGPDFKLVRYDYDTCLDFGGAGPIYESENGPLEYVEYPRLGVALKPEGNRVTEIAYLSEPQGPKESQCKGKKQK